MTGTHFSPAARNTVLARSLWLAVALLGAPPSPDERGSAGTPSRMEDERPLASTAKWRT